MPVAHGFYYRRSDFGPGLPVINAIIHVSGIPRSIEVEFLVDTGSATTTLMGHDPQRLDIDYWGIPFEPRRSMFGPPSA